MSQARLISNILPEADAAVNNYLQHFDLTYLQLIHFELTDSREPYDLINDAYCSKRKTSKERLMITLKFSSLFWQVFNNRQFNVPIATISNKDAVIRSKSDIQNAFSYVYRAEQFRSFNELLIFAFSKAFFGFLRRTNQIDPNLYGKDTSPSACRFAIINLEHWRLHGRLDIPTSDSMVELLTNTFI